MSKDFSPRPLYYLRCSYGPGLWDHESIINFKSRTVGYCHINNTDLKPINSREGLAKIIIKEFGTREVLIEINDVWAHRKSEFFVPPSEIVENPAIADVLK